MENQENNPPVVEQASVPQAPVVTNGSKKMLYVAIAVVVLALLAGALYFVMVSNKNTAVVPGYNMGSQSISATPTPTPTPESSVTPIKNSSDLNGALNQVNASDTSSLSAGLDQNTSDSTTFSQ
jgi:flagellar basal body-associated protein FliL